MTFTNIVRNFRHKLLIFLSNYWKYINLYFRMNLTRRFYVKYWSGTVVLFANVTETPCSPNTIIWYSSSYKQTQNGNTQFLLVPMHLDQWPEDKLQSDCILHSSDEHSFNDIHYIWHEWWRLHSTLQPPVWSRCALL